MFWLQLKTVIKFSELRVSLYDGSKEVENGEGCIHFAAWSSANEIVPTPLCVPCVGIMYRDLFGVNSTRVVHLSVH